nr:retrovirus-related Pol polyprotein from transposon TNT 1-94 [Tanacetum cinerariifolium]
MLPPNNLGSDESGVSVNETLFKGMIRYQANPKESNLVVVKRIFMYLNGTPNLGLWYLKGLGFDLKAYSDSDYAREPVATADTTQSLDTSKSAKEQGNRPKTTDAEKINEMRKSKELERRNQDASVYSGSTTRTPSLPYSTP